MFSNISLPEFCFTGLGYKTQPSTQGWWWSILYWAFITVCLRVSVACTMQAMLYVVRGDWGTHWHDLGMTEMTLLCLNQPCWYFPCWGDKCHLRMVFLFLKRSRNWAAHRYWEASFVALRKFLPVFGKLWVVERLQFSSTEQELP